MESDDEPITLSRESLAALNIFQQEKEAEKERFAVLQARAQARFSHVEDQPASEEASAHFEAPDIDLFKEDWQLSQFWYSADTAESLAEELLSHVSQPSHFPLRIGVLCAPSVYPKLLARQAEDAWLFEYDTRFEVLAGPKFVKYDYNHPTQIPAELKGSFDRLIIDPPFLSDECEIKAATSARWLGKPDARFIVCSGAKMRDLLLRIYSARETKFTVEHQNGRLSNDFMCLLNYSSDNVKKFGFVEDNAIKSEYSVSSNVA